MEKKTISQDKPKLQQHSVTRATTKQYDILWKRIWDMCCRAELPQQLVKLHTIVFLLASYRDLFIWGSLIHRIKHIDEW